MNTPQTDSRSVPDEGSTPSYSMLISVMSAGIVPEYSVVRYYVKGSEPVTGYVLQGESILLVCPFSESSIALDAEDFVELLATPAATACFYMGNYDSTQL